MIYGIGTDLCDVRRMQATLARRGMRFLERVLNAQELAVWRQRSQRWPERGVRYAAARFSAKEAFSKALGLGIRHPMRWRDCAILNRASGQPEVVLSGALAAWCGERGLQAHISLSDESDYVVSFCVIEVASDRQRAGDPARAATARTHCSPRMP